MDIVLFFKVIAGLAVYSITGFWAVWKMIDKRATKTEDLLLQLVKDNAKTVTVGECIVNSRAADERVRVAVLEVKTEVLSEIEAVEYRLDKRISKLEDKVA